MHLGHLPFGRLEHREGIVFDFYGPRIRPCISEDVDEFPHEPSEQIDDMDALVEQLAAAADLPIRAPLLFIARPAAMAVNASNEIQLSQLALLDQAFCLPDRGMVAMIEPGLEDAPGASSRPPHRFRFPGISSQRFLAQDMLSALERGDRDVFQEYIRGSDNNRFDPRIIDDGSPIRGRISSHKPAKTCAFSISMSQMRMISSFFSAEITSALFLPINPAPMIPTFIQSSQACD